MPKISNIGQIGEEIATKYLKMKGFIVLSRNYTVQGIGEIDIIAVKDGILRFIEVKSSADIDIYDARHTSSHLDQKKKDRIVRVMQRYCFTNNISIPRCVDLVSVSIRPNVFKAEVALFENIYIDTI